jgi:sugar phosphate permease
MWPTGVSLASEAWADVSRPFLAGLLGASANVGIVAFNVVAYIVPVTADSWRWTLLMCSLPAIVGAWAWFAVPESKSWLAARLKPASEKKGLSTWDVFRPPLLKLTIVGIMVGTVPLFGGWGATQWLILWSEQVLHLDPSAKALTAIMRSTGGTLGSLIGGWLANLCGRRATYFVISLVSLGLGEFIYLRLNPEHVLYSGAVFALGFVTTIFFGWLPLYLPELFPTHARALGSGVSFNFGRILTAVGVLATGWITSKLDGNFGRAGSYTMLIYAVGMIFILFAPDTTKREMKSG